MAGVGTEKIFENDKVIVWNFSLAPGEETPIHTRPCTGNAQGAKRG